MVDHGDKAGRSQRYQAGHRNRRPRCHRNRVIENLENLRAPYHPRSILTWQSQRVCAGCSWLVMIAVARVTGNGANILHVIFDDLRPDLGAYGREWDRTPHLGDFAQESATFEQAHAAVASCGPSRVAFMAGRRPDWNGVVDLVTHPRDRDHDVVMLPQALRERESAFRFVTVSGCTIIVAPPPSS